SLCVTENWDRLMERGVDILFQPGTHDYVAFDVPWGAQNHPQLPVYYEPNGGHSQTPHVATAKDEQNKDAFLWHHFFGGESLLKPPTSSHKVDKAKLTVSVSFKEGPQPISGRIWWIYDRAPEGSAPFLHVKIPDDQWMDMECDAKTGAWTATIPLKDGFDRIDFFSNHGHMANGYKQYLSSPYTRVEASDPALNETLAGINARFKTVDVELIEWPDELHRKLGRLKKTAFMASPVKKPAGKLPLLISLHGAGGRKMSVEEQLTRSAEVKGLRLAELAGKDLILLEPNSAGMWDVGSLNTMLDYILENYQEIDANRVYVMGHSMGGWGTWAWINESADRFAAAAPCGFSAGGTGDVERLVDLPIWAMIGGDDKIDRVTGIKQMVERLRASGNRHVKHTLFAGADHAQGNAAVFSSVELVDWMLGFSREK
ncbi:MAG: carboxylesterase family protein, partial [Planctomycetota bacterium]